MATRARGLTAAAAEQRFLVDAFTQLDDLLARKATAPTDSSMLALQQQIQRWLVVFAREHLADICARLMRAAALHVADTPALSSKHLPKKADAVLTIPHAGGI